MPTSLERKTPRRLERAGQNSKPLLSTFASRIERGLSCFHWVCYGSTKPGSSACADGQGQKNSDIGEVAVGLSYVLLTAYCLPPSAHWASINPVFNSHRTYCQFQPCACFPYSSASIPALAWVGLGPQDTLFPGLQKSSPRPG